VSSNYQYLQSDHLRAELPKHWEEKALKFVSMAHSQAFVDGPFGSDLKSGEYVDDGIPLIQLNNIRDGHHVLRNMKFITDEKKLALSRHVARPGDLVFAKMAEPVARTALVSCAYDEYVIVADCVKMSADAGLVDTGFLVWAVNSDCVRINAELVSTGTTRIRISLGELKRLRVPFPPLEEQTQIAKFLDYETLRIDALIEKQQQLIALLKEKRQAVISHAVTKGLNPDAPMRDSGVEWLGAVPAHWEVKRIKNLAATISKGTTPSTIGKDMTDAGIRFIKGENVGKGLAVSKSPEFYISESTDKLLERSRLERGDVLVIIAGATTGLCSVVEADVLPANTNQAVSFVRPLSLNHSHLIARWLSTEFAQRMIWMGAVQAAQPNLSMEDLGNIPIAVPPTGELEGILNEVIARNEQLDQLIEQADAMSELLQERRTALISAAVTGKIDVRGWKATESATEAEVA
jgi:type I restriction enzyme, S subunit